MNFIFLRYLFMTTWAATFLPLSLFAADGDTTVVSVFHGNGIHWGEVSLFQNDSVKVLFGGRIISRNLELPEFDNPVHITAQLEVIPDDGGVSCAADPWDKAGFITLNLPFQQPVELVKFITGYGGHTFHDIDVSDLAPVLRGQVNIQAFIDTWLSPAWKVTFRLVFIEDSGFENPSWATAVYNNQQLMRENVSLTEPAVDLDVPAGLDSFRIAYYTSGHSHIGSGGDEFETKANVIYVDETEVLRVLPWRKNCSSFALVNPCGNYPPSRSGWCPGDEVDPRLIDVTDYMHAGLHTIRHSVENIRETHGYWRISSYLVGWAGDEQIIPVEIGLEALEGTELFVDEVTTLRIRLKDALGHWIHNAGGIITLQADQPGMVFLDREGNWTPSPNLALNRGELLIHMRSEDTAQNARVWAADAGGSMDAPDTLSFNISRTYADTVGFNLSFDGTDDYVDLGNTPSLRLTGNTITMEAKIYAEEFKTTEWAGVILAKDEGGTGVDFGYMIRCGGNGLLNMNLGNGSWHELNSPANTLPLKTWTHVAGTYDGSKLRLYVNGNMVAESNTLTINIGDAVNRNLLIGDSPKFPGRVFNGKIDDVRLWNIARTREQIQQTMLGKLDSVYVSSADSGLIGYWNLDEGQGQQVMDQSVQGNHGTLGSTGDADINDPQWANANPASGFDDSDNQMPTGFSLQQNFPNPFNPETVIHYQIGSHNPGTVNVGLNIYNMLGQKMSTLVSGPQKAGRYTVRWEGTDDAGVPVPSGIYICQMRAGTFRASMKMLLLR